MWVLLRLNNFFPVSRFPYFTNHKFEACNKKQRSLLFLSEPNKAHLREFRKPGKHFSRKQRKIMVFCFPFSWKWKSIVFWFLLTWRSFLLAEEHIIGESDLSFPLRGPAWQWFGWRSDFHQRNPICTLWQDFEKAIWSKFKQEMCFLLTISLQSTERNPSCLLCNPPWSATLSVSHVFTKLDFWICWIKVRTDPG